eukprot:6441963-Alexandrium_andersonii.AAC.1
MHQRVQVQAEQALTSRGGRRQASGHPGRHATPRHATPNTKHPSSRQRQARPAAEACHGDKQRKGIQWLTAVAACIAGPATDGSLSAGWPRDRHAATQRAP